MPLSVHLAEGLAECYVAESRRPSDQPLRYSPGGEWFCPACGVRTLTGADFVKCPRCDRALNEFIQELIEYHPHA
jgi:rubrerythrin